MPLHQSHTVQWDNSDVRVFLFATNADGTPQTRLPLSEATAAYVRTGHGATEIAVSAGTAGSLHSGEIAEVDAELLPGVYEFAVPAEVVASGATEAVLIVQAPGATFDPIKFNLVAYDPQDAWSLGMTQLQDYKRHQVLRQALPRFTEMELQLGEENEQRLADSLGEAPPAWARESAE